MGFGHNTHTHDGQTLTKSNELNATSILMQLQNNAQLFFFSYTQTMIDIINHFFLSMNEMDEEKYPLGNFVKPNAIGKK
jgi:hypothetical protein